MRVVLGDVHRVVGRGRTAHRRDMLAQSDRRGAACFRCCNCCPPASLAPAGQTNNGHVPAVVGDQPSHARPHGPSVAPDVADELPGEPVKDAIAAMLAAEVAQAPLQETGQAGPSAGACGSAQRS